MPSYATLETFGWIVLGFGGLVSLWVFVRYPPFDPNDWAGTSWTDEDLQQEKLRREWEEMQEEKEDE